MTAEIYLTTRFTNLKSTHGDNWKMTRDEFFAFVGSDPDMINRLRKGAGYKIGRVDATRPFTAENIAAVPYNRVRRDPGVKNVLTRQMRKPRLEFKSHRTLSLEQWIAELRDSKQDA